LIKMIKSINLTYTNVVDSFGGMNPTEQTQDHQHSAEPSDHECECPEPCNCDHENE